LRGRTRGTRGGRTPRPTPCSRRAELREFNGEPDHAHLLVHYPPKIALSRLVGSLKGVSARRLRQEFPAYIRRHLRREHFWSPYYLAASCSGAPLTTIKDYIDQQNRPA
jgi:putative transposase